MSKLRTALQILKNNRQQFSEALFRNLSQKGLLDFLTDKKYIELQYRANVGKKLNLSSPKTFNEKLQWLKLNDRCSEYTTMVDKYEVKKYVADIIGSEYIIPTLGVWEKAEDIDFNALPNSFVLKWNHDSGSIVICKEKDDLDIEKTIKKLKNGKKKNGYQYGKEWPYKNVKPRIIAEQYMEDEKTSELRDYKFFCFNGKVKALFIATDRYTEGKETCFDFFDPEFNHLDLRQGHPNAKQLPEKPKNFDLMKELAEKLSVDIPHVRVDFYEVNGRVYFGEMTFFHYSGIVPFEPEEWDYKFGEWLALPKKKTE